MRGGHRIRRVIAGDRFDLVVIGLGSGGIAAARFAAGLGRRVAAVERGRIGGECLWSGCVPSKALIASARAAHAGRQASALGVTYGAPDIDGAATLERIRAIQRQIGAAGDSPQTLTAAGVDLISGHARVLGPGEVEVEGRLLRTRFILLCTGSSPAIPEIPGLREGPYLTSETVWDLERIPRRTVVLGGGPISCELGQALRRLGSEVAIVETGARLLPRDEPELAAYVHDSLVRDGVEIAVDAAVAGVQHTDGLHTLHGRVGDRTATWTADALLVATGRVPNTADLGLDSAGVATSPDGIDVDDRLRTGVPGLWAAGDVTSRPRFTHAAVHEATTAVRNMFFPGSSAASSVVPWCTFTDPELAHAGLTVREARARHGAGAVRVHDRDLATSDRGRADGLPAGRLLLVSVKDRLVGAGVVAPGAGEIIHVLALAIDRRMRLRDLSGLVHVYPTLSWEIAMAAADASMEHARRLRVLTRFARP